MIQEFHGKKPLLKAGSYVHKSAQVIGDVVVGENSSIWLNAVVRGDENYIRIGKNSNIQDGSILHSTKEKFPLEIGDNVSIAHGCVVHGCRIGNDVIVGIGAKVLDGASIGDNCIIGAGSVVTEGAVIPPKSLVLGIPGKVKRELTFEDIDRIRRTYENYLEEKEKYRAIEKHHA